MKNKLDEDYLNLLAKIIKKGNKNGDRTGVGTVSIFGEQIRHSMADGFPLLTSKEVSLKNVITELLWFLKGETNIKTLLDNDCNIWNGDAWKNYQTKTAKSDNPYPTKKEFIQAIKNDKTFADIWGELGPIYGKQWRKWKANCGADYVDQISNLLNDLKTNPDSRRLMVNAWNVSDMGYRDLRSDEELYQDYLKKL